jgi:hypothetical protein
MACSPQGDAGPKIVMVHRRSQSGDPRAVETINKGLVAVDPSPIAETLSQEVPTNAADLSSRNNKSEGSTVFDGTEQSSSRHNQEQPVVWPHVSHFMQVPLRTSVKLPHSAQASPS